MAAATKIRVADLVAEGGTAGNAEDLINAVYSARPGQLVKAISLRHHERVHAQRAADNPNYDAPETPVLKLADVEKAAGLGKDDPKVIDAAIHGEDIDKAWVVYVAEDGVGSHYKGCYPYSDHAGKGASNDHHSEADAFLESEVGQKLAKRREEEEDDGLSATKRTRRSPAAKKGDGDGDDE